uniref:Uncharacterized protein n=1 Tax=Grammatophora oceanica TaxID=210454 RepID=A0A7S1UQ63_9STRA
MQGVGATLPIQIVSAFGMIEAEIEKCNLPEGYFQRMKKINQAYDILFVQFSNAPGFPMQLLKPDKAVKLAVAAFKESNRESKETA